MNLVQSIEQMAVSNLSKEDLTMLVSKLEKYKVQTIKKKPTKKELYGHYDPVYK
jgi:hypothetical protein